MHPHFRTVQEFVIFVVVGFIVVAALVLSLGCASINRQLDTLPAGSADEVTYTRTGKFSSTQIHVEGWKKDGTQASADVLTVQHSNAWIPNLNFTAKGYKRIRESGAEALVIPAVVMPPEVVTVPLSNTPAEPDSGSAPAAPSVTAEASK